MVAIETDGKRIVDACAVPLSIIIRGIPVDLSWSVGAMDMVEVAAAVFLADRVVARPRTDGQGRVIHLRIPVRDPKPWRDAQAILQRVLWTLGNDEVTFDFVSSKIKESCLWMDPIYPGLEYKNDIENVMLFSGGLDSAAACTDFSSYQHPTAYLTHYFNGVHRIEDLLSSIYSAYANQAKKLHICVYTRHRIIPPMRLRESSRRSRPFLFVSLALAIALVLEAKRVLVCENGPLALNLKMLPSMIPTRHAHSDFLLGMQELARTIFGVAIVVSNPYELETKGEMARAFKRHPEIALRTISCWNQQWAGIGSNHGKGHCGYCMPCLIRRAALKSAGIQIPQEHFDVDIIKLMSSAGNAKAQKILGPLRALLKFTQTLTGCSDWRDFIRQFPECIESQPTSLILSQEQWFIMLFRTMRRFAREVSGCFRV